MKLRNFFGIVAATLVSNLLIASPVQALGPIYVVTCTFSDGEYWVGSTRNHVQATTMVSRCEGTHGGTASFAVEIAPQQ